MGEISCIFCLFRSIWIRLLCYDHTNNMTSGFNIFIEFLSNLSSSLFWFYVTNNHLKVCENRDINVLFISGGKSCYHKVGLKVWYNELGKQNFARDVIDGLMQEIRNSIANALGTSFLLQVIHSMECHLCSPPPLVISVNAMKSWQCLELFFLILSLVNVLSI